VLAEPHERLTCAAEFGHLVEDQADCLLDTLIRVLLQPVASFDEAHRRRDDQLAAAGLLVAARVTSVKVV
jgi:hypothetical protein